MVALSQGELSMKVAQLLGLQGPWQHQLFRDTNCLCHRSYGPICWGFFCLFFLFVCFGFFEPLEPGDQDSLASLSLWLPHSGTYRAPLPEVFLCYSARAHRGAPQDGVLLCRSVHQALKGAHWVGSCSVVQCIRHSMGQPLYCSAADADVLGGESLW